MCSIPPRIATHFDFVCLVACSNHPTVPSTLTCFPSLYSVKVHAVRHCPTPAPRTAPAAGGRTSAAEPTNRNGADTGSLIDGCVHSHIQSRLTSTHFSNRKSPKSLPDTSWPPPVRSSSVRAFLSPYSVFHWHGKPLGAAAGAAAAPAAARGRLLCASGVGFPGHFAAPFCRLRACVWCAARNFRLLDELEDAEKSGARGATISLVSACVSGTRCACRLHTLCMFWAFFFWSFRCDVRWFTVTVGRCHALTNSAFVDSFSRGVVCLFVLVFS